LKCILLVEDEEILAQTLAAYLEEFDFTVEWASDCASAKEAMKTQKFLGVVVDKSLPDAQGIQLMPCLEGLDYRPRIIVHSGDMSPSEEAEFRQSVPRKGRRLFFSRNRCLS
jgi:DNA-binding response OmpR family regulator